MPEVVADTSPLQYLHQIGHLDLLERLYREVLVPRDVVNEIDEGLRRGVVLPVPAQTSWIRIVDPPGAELLALASDLGAGERAVLALGVARKALVILDDGLARRYASLLGLHCTGTLGVLIRAKRDGLVHRLEPLLDRLQEQRFRLAPAVRAQALELAGE
jgi:predicted nucleic acid-binding protein